MRDPEDRGQNGTIFDLTAGTWRTQRFILIAYLIIALIGLVTWTQGFTVLALVAALVAWAGQWGLTVIVLRVLHSRFGKFFRNTTFMTIAVIVMVIVMVVLTSIAFGPDARINGWVILWRVIATLLITTFASRLYALGRILERERETQNTLRTVRTESLDAIRTQRQSVIDQINDQMNRALQRASVKTIAASAELSQFAREYLRPLSHEILNDDPLARSLVVQNPKKITWREIAGAVSLQPALRPWLMATAVFIAFLLTTVETTEQTTANVTEATGVGLSVESNSAISSIVFLGLAFVITGVSATILQRWLTPLLPRLSMRSRLILLALVPITIAVIMQLFVQLLFLVPGFVTDSSTNLFLRLVPATAIVVIALIVVLNRTLKELFFSVEEQERQATRDLTWELSRLRCTTAREQRFFASQLHGPLQSTFTSAAMRTADIEPGAPEWHDTLAAVKTDFESTIERLTSGPETTSDINRALEELRRTWTGVCEIETMIEDGVAFSLNSDWVASGIVNDIIIEACANAAIHGSAKNVRIDMRWCDIDELLITVVNDGATEESGPPGLGTAMLNSVAMSWSREVVPEGLRLTVTLAVPRVNSKVDASV